MIRSGHEPYDDVGAGRRGQRAGDRLRRAGQPGPGGRRLRLPVQPGGDPRAAWRWDGPAGSEPGEPWVDAGLDGVPGTPQQGAGGYDFGEGNDVFDQSPYFQNYLEHDGYTPLANMSDADLDRIDVLADAGIRDLFPFAAGENSMLAPLNARGRQARPYNEFSALSGGSYLDEQIDPDFEIDLPALGRHTMIRYGNPDADEIAVGARRRRARRHGDAAHQPPGLRHVCDVGPPAGVADHRARSPATPRAR
ncbi:MAG: hypothetical protein MZV70_00275 [Desulfobacterales bacterium]|nr:hypothetical protein [Desulfobacterales bacterium]